MIIDEEHHLFKPVTAEFDDSNSHYYALEKLPKNYDYHYKVWKAVYNTVTLPSFKIVCNDEYK